MNEVSSAPRPRVGRDLHERPSVGLVYLFFVFLPLVFERDIAPESAIASVLAVLLFLPMHFASFRRSLQNRHRLAWPMAMLGYALIPFNPGGNTFIVYAAATAAHTSPPRRAIATSLVAFALMSAEFFWLYPRPAEALGVSAVTAVIATMVVAGVLYSREQQRRNAELQLTQDEVRRLAEVAERERIGRDLHDLLGHTLSVIVLKSELAGKLIERDAAAARAQIREVEQVARQALTEVREAVSGYRASGLQAELAAARLALLSAGVHLDQRLQPIELDPAVEAVLAFAVREATTNVLRHAQAQRFDVELLAAGDGVRLTLADDGRGGLHVPGNGLTGMRERVAALGGELRIDSPSGGGTRLSMQLPQRPQVHARTRETFA